MPDTNGAGRFPGPTVLGARRRLSAVPKTVTFDIETVIDGVVSMIGYCKGESCPVSVTIEAETAHDVWQDATYRPATDEERAAWEQHLAACQAAGIEPGPCPIDDDGEVYHYSHAAELTYRRDMLIAVVPGLEKEAASVLAADGGGWRIILADLGYIKALPVDETALPEAVGEDGPEAPTGADSSPSSAPSTASAPASS